RHEEHTAGVQQRGRGHRNVAAETRSDQHQIAGELLAELHQPGYPGSWLIDAAVIHRVRVVSFGACHLGERGDLASPGTASLTVRENDMTGSHGRLHGRASGAGRTRSMGE